MLNEYLVYFELYGKKMKKKVLAKTSIDAKGIVKKNLIIHKADRVDGNNLGEVADMFQDIIDTIGGKTKS